MSRFHRLTIRDVRSETRDALSIAFDIPAELQERFRFTQGQHLVIRTQVEGEELRRSYSICSGVNDGELRVAIKKVDGGRFSTHAHRAFRVGSRLDVMPPAGHFQAPLDPQRRGHYLAVAAGSGITPILSIIKTTLETEPLSQVTLLYGNRSGNATLFREQLEDLKNRYLQRLNLIFVFSRERQDVDLYNGRIDAAKCAQLFDRWLDVPSLTAAFICGPHGMLDTVREQLANHGLPTARIHVERFGAAGTGERRTTRQAAAVAGTSSTSQITVIHDGRTLSFDLARDGASLLEAGNAQGAELPYSCKAGVCSTCKCRVLEGEVEMDSNFALEDYEVSAGYVLSCQAYPLSDKVVLDFDQR